MDRFGRKFAIVPSFLIQAVGMALLPITGSFEALLFVTTVLGFGNGLGSGTMMTLGADLSPPGSGGEFLGVWRLIGDAGFAGAPLVVGAVADLFVLPAAALAMSASGFAAVLIFSRSVPETLGKHRSVAHAD
jgi:MFS family permease